MATNHQNRRADQCRSHQEFQRGQEETPKSRSAQSAQKRRCDAHPGLLVRIIHWPGAGVVSRCPGVTRGRRPRTVGRLASHWGNCLAKAVSRHASTRPRHAWRFSSQLSRSISHLMASPASLLQRHGIAWSCALLILYLPSQR